MGALTDKQLLQEIQKGHIVVSPILDLGQVEHGSVNLRLGCEFIIPKRSELTAIYPDKTTTTNIQRIQNLISIPFGGKFVLHPGELVLGATFEYVGMPANRCGLVLSRSSYGRLGLLVATAVYVHPLWRGWLTLELVNTGTLPIELSSGSAVAQLVVEECGSVTIPKDYYLRPRIPTGPQFAALAQREDQQREWSNLKKVRELIQGPGEN